jgi:hypothetical protein
MADVKISGLPASTVPLAGTEVLPIVQGGATKQVSVDNLTTGKAISVTRLTSTIATGTAPLTVASTTEVANLRSATATSADTANQVKSNATSGVLQVTGPGAAATRIMTTPDANFTAARTDAAQSFTGDQTLSTGNLVIGTSGKGIDFSATAGTGTSELLADYEEGTWTPTDGSGAGLTFGSAAGAYTKIGRMVYWQATILYPTTASASGASIASLPFALALVSGASGRAGSTITVTTVATLIQALQVETSNIVRFYKAGFVQSTNAELSGAEIYCAGFYST